MKSWRICINIQGPTSIVHNYQFLHTIIIKVYNNWRCFDCLGGSKSTSQAKSASSPSIIFTMLWSVPPTTSVWIRTMNRESPRTFPWRTLQSRFVGLNLLSEFRCVSTYGIGAVFPIYHWFNYREHFCRVTRRFGPSTTGRRMEWSLGCSLG